MYTRREVLRSLSLLTAGSAFPVTGHKVAARSKASGNRLEASGPPHSGSHAADTPGPTMPVIYTSDLFHPPDFLDDQVDLATLLALPELDVRAIVLEQGYRQHTRSGATPVEQMIALTGRRVPYAVGLAHPLRYPEDKASDAHPLLQKGVELIHRALREASSEVFMIVVGSARDTAAAFNRDEKLFREKVARVYLNIGNLPGGDLEWNAALDPQAYLRLMESNLPIYWCPCLGAEGSYELMGAGKLRIQQHQTYWMFRQSELLDALPAPLQNYFLYATGAKDSSSEDPADYLRRTPDKPLKERDGAKVREMFSTASIIHAAGRQLCRQGDSWQALASPTAECRPWPVFDFVPATVNIDRDLRTPVQISETDGRFRIFHLRDLENYEAAMRTSLRQLLAEMKIVLAAGEARGTRSCAAV